MCERPLRTKIDGDRMDTCLNWWLPPPENLTLDHEEVHVWRAMLDQSMPRIQLLEQTLTTDEQIRANLFRFPNDRSNYVVARGLLRTLLGQYLNREPHTLRFNYGHNGKPSLAGKVGDKILSFNVTHTYGMVMYAFTWGRNIGIDLEQILEDMVWWDIAESFFSPKEVCVLRTIPKGKQHEAFFACWTRKEAYVKAKGLGLSMALSQFDVSVTFEKQVALLESREVNEEISSWTLYDLSPGPGYVAALAVEGKSCRPSCWQWTESEKMNSL